MRKHRRSRRATLLAATWLCRPAAAAPTRVRPVAGPTRPRSPRSASSRRCPATCPRSASASATRSTWRSSRPTRRTPIPGWKLELDAEDDEAKPDVGKNAATKLAGDDEVVGVVGTLNSSVSQSVQPVLAAANIVQVSPANTGPALTKGPDQANPKRPYADVLPHLHHRRVQGPLRRPATCTTRPASRRSPPSTTRRPTARAWSPPSPRSSRSSAARSSTAETINPDDKDFSAVISKVKGAEPELVYYGGEYPQAGPLSQQTEGGRSERSADGWRRHLRPGLHRARRQDLRG